MKKAASIFLLGIFLFNTVGYYVFFKVAQSKIKSEIKKEIKLNIHSSELTAIEFTSDEINNLNWLEKGKEFMYHNQMFDIVKSKINANSITFYCINDKQEKKLFQNLEEQVLKQIEQNKNSKNNSSKKVADQQIKTYFLETIDFCIFQNISSVKHSPYKKKHSSVVTSITTPPPRI